MTLMGRLCGSRELGSPCRVVLEATKPLEVFACVQWNKAYSEPAFTQALDKAVDHPPLKRYWPVFSGDFAYVAVASYTICITLMLCVPILSLS
jgi:hypothetical protein